MIGNSTFGKAILWHTRGLVISVALGFLGGMICGAVILSLCGLSGRSGTTGCEYFGYWSVGLAGVGAMYGGPLGAIMGPLAYVIIIRKTGFKQAIVPATIGTIAGGFAGSLVIPGLGVPTGIAGFFIALFIVKHSGGWPRSRF